MKTKLMAALAIGALMLTGCGGGGGDGTSTGMVDPAGTPLSFVDLVVGDIVESGTYHLVGASDAFLEALEDEEVPADGYAPGSMITVGGVSFRCTADNTSNCNIAVHDDGGFTTVGTIATVLFGAEFPMTDIERLIAAERAKTEAEKARADAEKARADAAEAARQQEQAAREEAERQAAEAAATANQAGAKEAIEGLRRTNDIGDIDVTAKYAAIADVDAEVSGNAVNFASKSRSSASGGWSVTTLSNSGFTHNDDLVVYSNRGAPTRVLLTQGEYSSRFIDSETDTANTPISAAISNTDGRLIRSGSFPTQDGADKPFANNYENDDPPDTADGPDIVRFGGTFHGASGYFHCTAQPCTIGRRGDRYTIVEGTWAFHTTDAARALIDDKSYMYFGWWKREQKSNEMLTFETFHGVKAAAYLATVDATNFNLLGGSATYRGRAIGQYAIYQPLGAQSGTGSFTASAMLTANFTDNLLSGTVTGFSNDPDWSLTLNSRTMAGGSVAGGTTDWTIAGNTSSRQGAWEAVFFSEAPYVGQTPDGVVGDFTGIYDADADAENGDVGRIVGAFGARK